METKNHIEVTSGICSGRPRIVGTRLRVSQVLLLTEQGNSADEIVAAYPQLSLADVYAALAFYYDNREEIDQQIRDDNDFVSMIRDTDANGTAISS